MQPYNVDKSLFPALLNINIWTYKASIIYTESRVLYLKSQEP